MAIPNWTGWPGLILRTMEKKLKWILAIGFTGRTVHVKLKEQHIAICDELFMKERNFFIIFLKMCKRSNKESWHNYSICGEKDFKKK